MSRKPNMGRDATRKEIREARRIAALHPEQQREHPSSCPAEREALAHINTYGTIPDFYVDTIFTCRKCGKEEIWRARDQKWYYEIAKGHIDAKAVECHACRTAK